MTKTNKTKNRKEKYALKKELILGTMIVMLSMTIVQQAACNVQPVSISFRLLAVEATSSNGTPQQSGQYLIKALTKFPNWNNQTHTSYIQLLSRYTKQQCINEAKPYWVGNSTRVNVHDEIINFLGAGGPNDIIVFSIITDGAPSQLILDEIITAAELNSWLGTLSGTVCVVLDACYSGSFISDGEGGILGSGRIVLCSSRSDQLSWGGSNPYWGGVFTGYKSKYYPNGTYLPLGLIGGMTVGTDKNSDGWLSVLECFEYAKSSVDQYGTQNPIAFNGLGFDPPLVLLHPPVANFSFSPLNPKVNQSILFNASSSNGTITSYAWDFGDGNKTNVTQPLINHTYTQPNEYTVALNVTDSNGLWNTTSSIVNVTIVTPVNHDVAITNISPYRTIVSNRTMTSINVTIANQGDVQETFTIIASYNSTAFASQMITVGNGSSVKWLVIWNTTGVAIGNFTITAMVNQLPGETDIADNSNSSLIQVLIQGDINSDGKVDMKDVSYVARRFMRLPSDPSWDPNADINEDQKIDMKDISTVAKRFGEHYP